MSLISESNKRWWVFASFAFIFIIINLDMTVVNVALPTIAQEMHSTMAEMQWIINIFTLIMTSSLIIFGNLCRKYGALRIYIVGNIVFLTGSLLCGIAINETTLIGARVIQAIGIAAVFNPCFVIPMKYFSTNERGFVVSCIVSVSGIAQAIGPNVGGLLVEHFNWRWVFLLNVPLSLITIFMSRWICDPDGPINETMKIDYRSSLFLTLSITLLLVGFNNVDNWGFTSSKFLLSLGAAVVSTILFVFSQRNQKDKTINFSLFKNPAYGANIAIRFFFMYSFFVVLFVVPFYLQNIQEMSPSQSALVLIALSGTFGFFSPFAGKICDRVGVKTPAYASMIIAVVAFTLMAFTRPNSSIYLTIVSLFGIGLATSLIMPANARATTLILPNEQLASGLSFYTTAGFLGGAIGVGLSVSIQSTLSRWHFMKNTAQLGVKFSSQTTEQLKLIASGTHPISFVSKYVSPNQVEQVKTLVKNSYMQGYSFTAWTLCLLCLICLAAAFVLANTSHSTK